MTVFSSSSRSRTLNAISRCVEWLPVLHNEDLDAGDCVVVSTKNSVYRLRWLGGNLFDVSGGWFDRNPSWRPVTLNGCTFGGLAICRDVVAARGLFLEFGLEAADRDDGPQLVSTTRIQDVRVVKLAGRTDTLLN